MQLSKVDITGELRVTYDSGGEVWDRQIALFPSNKSSVLSGYYDLYWFDLMNGTKFGANISDDLALTNVLLDMGDGATTSFTGTAGPLPIKMSSVTVYHTETGAQTGTDDGAGNITGTNIATGTLDYATGAWTLDFTAAPETGTAIYADFTRGITSDDTLATGFTFELSTDVAPTLTDTAFLATVPLTVTPATVDRFEQNTATVYEVTMSASYTGADTEIVTALGLHYMATTGDSAGTVVSDNFLAKSTALLNNAIYDAGLVLMNASTITVKYRVKVTN